MPSYIALFLYIVMLIAVFRFDSRLHPGISKALWVPLIWMMIIGSRNPSQWLNYNPSGFQQAEYFQEYMGGNPTDKTVFMLLILIGLLILIKRSLSITQTFKSNVFIFIFFLYCIISVFWSDYPMVSFKRLIKATGDYIMVLIVLTERFPLLSIEAIIRRCAYVLVPGSVLLIKYFSMGRIFTPWGGSEFTGVSTSKNMLGALCLIFGFYFLWSLITLRKGNGLLVDKNEIYLFVINLLMILWLFIKAPSLTSIMSLVFSIALVIFLQTPLMRRNPGNIRILLVFAILSVLMIQLSQSIMPGLVSILGRDITLTGRVPLWSELLAMKTNSIIGVGYESFWLGQRLELIWSNNWWQPNQAHNGFIEIYLNLGWIGLILLGGILYSTYKNSKRMLATNFQFGVLRLAALFIIIMFSQLEAAFKGLHIMWFFFLLVAMEYSKDISSNQNK